MNVKGRLRFSSEEKSGSLPQFFVPQNWVFRIFPLTSPLSYHPFATVGKACKTVSPTEKLQGALQEGKESGFQFKQLMRVKRMTIKQGKEAQLSRFPNFHSTGSVAGMKKLYYGQNCLLVKCGDYIYNVSSEPEIYNQAK